MIFKHLFDPYMQPQQILAFQVRVNQRLMKMKAYTRLSIYPASQMQFSPIALFLEVVFLRSRKYPTPNPKVKKD